MAEVASAAIRRGASASGRVRDCVGLVGGGFGGINPVLVTVRLSHANSERTAAVVRGAAKEVLVKQRVGPLRQCARGAAKEVLVKQRAGPLRQCARGAAKEVLVKQRAGERTAKALAQLLAL
jgi:hypothetical protein